jgi:hypothetical protein
MTDRIDAVKCRKTPLLTGLQPAPNLTPNCASLPVMPTVCTFDISQSTLNFPRPFVDRPRLAHGIRELDVGNNANIRVTSRLQNVTESSADCQITSWGDTTLYSAAVDVLALAPGDLDFLTGEHTRNLLTDPDAPASVRINFERPFPTPPNVVVFFNYIDLDRNRNWRLETTATDIDAEGFTLNIETWSNTIFYSAQGFAGLRIQRILNTFSADLLTQNPSVPGINLSLHRAAKSVSTPSSSGRNHQFLSP